MKTLSQWMADYSQSHQSPLNKTIHIICVPLIMWSSLGLLWAIPKPVWMQSMLWLNFATLSAAITIPFYILLSLRVGLSMLVLAFVLCLSLYAIEIAAWPLLRISLTVFILAWIGQFIGHKIEGKKPSFFEDLQFLLIGPVWVLKSLRFPI